MPATDITGTMTPDGIVWDDPAKAEAFFTAHYATPEWQAFVARAEARHEAEEASRKQAEDNCPDCAAVDAWFAAPRPGRMQINPWGDAPVCLVHDEEAWND